MKEQETESYGSFGCRGWPGLGGRRATLNLEATAAAASAPLSVALAAGNTKPQLHGATSWPSGAARSSPIVLLLQIAQIATHRLMKTVCGFVNSRTRIAVAVCNPSPHTDKSFHGLIPKQ